MQKEGSADMGIRCHILLLYAALLPGILLAQAPSDSLAPGIELKKVSIEASASEHSDFQVEFGRNQIKLHANAPLGSLLEESPAVFVKSYGPSGSSTPAFRGTGASHTQVYWNGIPINSPMLGLTDLSLGTAGMFDGVSLLYGPASSWEGDGGLGGAVLLENQRPVEGQRIALGQEVASFGNLRSNLQLEMAKGRWHSVTKANYLSGRNNFTYQNTARLGHPLDTLEHSALQQTGILQEIGFAPSRSQRFVARVWWNAMDRELPPTMLTQNLTESQTDQSLRSMLEWQMDGPGPWKGTVKGAFFSENLHYQNGLAEIDSKSHIQQAFVDAKVQRSWGNKLWQEAGFRASRISANSNGYPQPVLQTNVTAFSNVVYRPVHPLRLALLLRETLQSGRWSLPALSFESSIDFDRGRQRLALNAGRNFRFPGFNDMYWQPGGNPDLLPERSWSADLALRQRFSLGRLHLRGDFSAYVNKVEDMIQWQPGTASYWTAENVHAVLIRGFESSVRLEKGEGKWRWSLLGSHAWTRSENLGSGHAGDHSAGKQLIYVPLHSGLLRFRIERGHWTATASQQFTGSRFTTRDNSQELPGFSLGSFRLSRTWTWRGARIECYAAIANAWNVSYQSLPWRPMPGRNGLGGINLEWTKPRQK